VIRDFRHKGLAELFNTGNSKRIKADLTSRVERSLTYLRDAIVPEDMNLPGLHFHALHGKPRRYSVRVSGAWRITFGWDGADAVQVDLEQYH